MTVNVTSRTLSGIVSIILGLYTTINIILDKPENGFWCLISGILLVIIGIFIFLNKK
ncbi:hypothetical protein KKC45_00660 [Patescibacteria group bacterium]|nr:hypothetical protein [Patescibacteria group bacterium]